MIAFHAAVVNSNNCDRLLNYCYKKRNYSAPCCIDLKLYTRSQSVTKTTSRWIIMNLATVWASSQDLFLRK